MAESSIILIGCCVEGNYGSLKSNSKLDFNRHIQKNTVGTVVYSHGCHKWVVVLNENDMARIIK